jgi:hypothetical protein
VRAHAYRQQLVHAVHRLLRWLGLGTSRARFDWLATWCMIALALDISQHHHRRAFAWLVLYIYCSRRAR